DASFFPISDVGWPQVAATPPPENLRNGGKNFYFTTVTRVFFEYQPGQSLNFSGDDDVWVFVDGRLVLDIGGLHPEVADSFTLNGATTDRSGAPLNLNEGGIYDLVLFHAERRTGQSNFNLTLNNFEAPLTRCTTICGDGIKTPQEQCDDGNLIDDDDCSNDCMRKDLQGGLI
ncbi:MAG: fibro-slime domain-containing protein, partial [Polyangiales bacterium]